MKLLKNKEETKVENKKISISSVLIILLFAVALIYVIGLYVKSKFVLPEVYTTQNIKQYIASYEQVTSDYFYTIDLQVANFLESVDNDKYSELYSILAEGYNRVYSRKDIINYLKDCKKNVFIYKNDNKNFSGHLINAYKIDDYSYIAQLDFNGGEFYLFFKNELRNYTFAIVK